MSGPWGDAEIVASDGSVVIDFASISRDDGWPRASRVQAALSIADARELRRQLDEAITEADRIVPYQPGVWSKATMVSLA